MAQIMHDGENFSIRPSHISTEGHLFDAFDHYESEISARYIVRLCQQRNSWSPFTLDEIEAVYQSAGHADGFWFNRLISDGWIVERDGKYFITEGFIRCVRKSSLLDPRANFNAAASELLSGGRFLS